mgnify:CR=1 FL=1
MGQKVHPIGFRLGIASDWTSKWYAERGDYSKNLFEDIQVRKFIKQKLLQAAVSRIQIERPAKQAVVTIHTARPGVVIGKKGEDIERLRQEVAKILSLPVKPRARRIALMVASVPELTIRTCSIDGTISITFSAILISSSVGAPKERPFSTA